MKKSKKLLIALLVATLAMTFAVAFAACDGDDKKEPVTNTKSYQLVGEFAGELASFGMEYSFSLDLKVDGSAVLSRYNMASYNHEPAATNKAYEAEFMKGTWKATPDADGVDSLQIKIGIEESKTTYYAYQSGSDWEVRDISFPLAGGFSRTVSLKGGETKKYADGDAFINATKREFVAPANVGTFKDAEKNGTVYLQEDGKLLVYSGYTNVSKGTWAKDSAKVYINIDDKDLDVTINGKKATFAYTYVMQGDYKTDFTFTLADFTTLPDKSAPVDKNLFTGKQGDSTWKLKLNDTTTCKLSTSMGGYEIGFDCTYTKADNVVTVTIIKEPTNESMVGIWKGAAKSWTINTTDQTMTPVVA